MTRRRRQVLLELADLAASGEKVRLAELARRCGLCDYREARRIVKDLERMGAVV
jgi:DNA-binding IclR family transcriptional regulator